MKEDKFFRCLGEENRLQILKVVGNDEKCVNEIVESLKKEQSLVSHHLRTLKDCGLVQSRQAGKKIMYKVSDSRIMDIIKRSKALAEQLKGECTEC